MRLKWLQLEHFRNYEKLNLDFTEANILALIGPNAQGKTNILESIAFLALGKSFRAKKTMETLTWDRPHGRIKAMVENNSKDTELEIFFQRNPDIKKVKKQKQLTTPKEFLGNFRVVLFTPDHLDLVSGGPRLRRQYLDRVLVQIDQEYLDALTNYQKILRQRNALLKTIQHRKSQSWELEIWDTRLANEAMKLWVIRKQFIDFLKANITKHYQEIANTKQELTIVSHTHSDRFEERLLAHRESDIRTGSTSVGPHRDDFEINFNDRPLAEFGSRGECRSAVLSLKIAEIHYIEQESGQKPILLLDDVFSELDSDRQMQLGALLQEYQSVITTTSLSHIKGLKDAKVFQVNNGELTEK